MLPHRGLKTLAGTMNRSSICVDGRAWLPLLFFGQTFFSKTKKNAKYGRMPGMAARERFGWDAVAYAIGGGAFLLGFSSIKAARFL